MPKAQWLDAIIWDELKRYLRAGRLINIYGIVIKKIEFFFGAIQVLLVRIITVESIFLYIQPEKVWQGAPAREPSCEDWERKMELPQIKGMHFRGKYWKMVPRKELINIMNPVVIWKRDEGWNISWPACKFKFPFLTNSLCPGNHYYSA